MATIGASMSGDFSDYSITAAKVRFGMRRVRQFDARKRSAISRSGTHANNFNPATCPDGQSLAGTGALVFEGELLER